MGRVGLRHALCGCDGCLGIDGTFRAAQMKKALDAIWAEEAGVMVYIYEGDNGSRIIEIHGIGEDLRETVLATATIAGFRRDRLAKLITTQATRRDTDDVPYESLQEQ